MRGLNSASHTYSRTGLYADCAALFAAVAITSAPFVSHLGFYSDDWNYIAGFADPHVSNHLRSVLASDPNLKIRPLQLIELALNFKLFRVQPLGYHVVSVILLGLLSICVYLALRQKCGNRCLSFGCAILFSVLPHYSTDRLWLSSQQTILCMIFAVLGVYALMRAAASYAQPRATWYTLATLTFALSLLAYEVALGLILAALAVTAWQEYRALRASAIRRWAAITGVALCLLAVLLVKARLQTRVPLSNHSLTRFLSHVPAFTTHAAVQMLTFTFWTYGLRLPWLISKLQHLSAIDATTWTFAAIFTLLVTGYFWIEIKPATIPDRSLCLQLAATGLVLFALGYVLFFASTTTDFTTAGLDNRIAIISALAPAFVSIAATGLLCSVFPSPAVRRGLFSLLVGLICGSSYLALCGISSLWVAAANYQTAILHNVSLNVSALPPGGTLLLDGFCRYRGPGVVFETDWDTTGAVRLALNDFSLKADVVSPNLHFEDAGINSTIYGQPENHYEYGDHLFVFNVRSGTLAALPNRQAASDYLRAWNPTADCGCPPAYEGRGEKLF